MAKRVVQTQRDKEIMALVEEAREARTRFASVYNQYYDLAAPWRTRVGVKSDGSKPRSPAEQDDIFDSTLQDAVDDWASDCADEITPMYKHWAKYQVLTKIEDLHSQSVRDKIAELAKRHYSKIYDAIRASDYEQQSQESWVDFGIGPAGMEMPMTPAGTPLRFDHIPMSEILILPSPFGGPGDRFRERYILMRHLDVIWPDVDWEFLGSRSSRKTNKEPVEIIKAYTRDWSNRSEEVWTCDLMCNGKSVKKWVSRGPGSCAMIVARPRVSSPSAIGIGPANKAIAPARTLNVLAYLNLKRTGKAIDPPVAYSDDGTANVEGGMESGTWTEFGEGFQIQELAPQSDAREGWFTQEDLRMQVKRAMFQDKPYQRGDTPPTATQWLGEEETNARRKGFPRAAAINEWALPIIMRAEYVLKARNELEDAKIGGELVRFEPISPLSRASDLQEVQLVNQHVTMFVSLFGPEAEIYYDMPGTMKATAEKLGTEAIRLRSEEEVEQIRAQRAAQEAAAAGNIPGANQQ